MNANTLPTVALSLREPWATAVVRLGKTVENRVWSTKFRGPLFIHAAKGCTKTEYLDAVHWMVSRGLARSRFFGRSVFRVAGVDPATLPEIPPLEEMQRGGVIGRARLVDVIPPCASEPPMFERPCTHPWHMCEQTGFLLADVAPLPFVPLRGELGFFKVPAEIAERCAA